jgi:hypothetical protein
LRQPSPNSNALRIVHETSECQPPTFMESANYVVCSSNPTFMVAVTKPFHSLTSVVSVMAIFRQLAIVGYNFALRFRANGGLRRGMGSSKSSKRWRASFRAVAASSATSLFRCSGRTSQLPTLKASLTCLFEYLSGEGRTNANCWAVDMFFCLSEGWERDWTEQPLPDDFRDVLALTGQALHDTIRTPKIAENFDCLPEQLLDRVRRLACPQPGQLV